MGFKGWFLTFIQDDHVQVHLWVSWERAPDFRQTGRTNHQHGVAQRSLAG